jgi:predicted short-subunit dehydrogenase-like oxidoreductase (DUF2520 family)
MRSVSIIGIGRVGGALAIALSRAGFVVEKLVHRGDSIARSVSKLLPATVELVPGSADLPTIDSEIILITTPDPKIVGAAESLVGRLTKGCVVLHTSGSLSSESISPLRDAGYFTGSMHPLVSVSDAVSGADNFKEAFFCIEGQDKAVEAAREIVDALEGRPFSIDTHFKPLYHASAVTACGHLVALLDIAIDMLSKCGIERTHAKEILLPLVASTIANLKTQSPAEALTGSFARLDSEAIERHLSAIEGMDDEVKAAYLLLGERSLDLAESNGGNAGDARNVRDLISIAKRNTG